MGPRRTWMIVVGIIALVLAVPILIGGVALAAIFGTDGRFESGHEQIETSTRALVSAVADISADAPIDRGGVAWSWSCSRPPRSRCSSASVPRPT